MNPMMMMILPRLLSQGSSTQNPMSGFLMASLMKKMSSSSSESYEYDYDYDYDYGYGYEGSEDYDYDYAYEEDEPSSSPLSSIIQQMLQQKLLAARKPVVQVSLNSKSVEPAEIMDAPSPLQAEVEPVIVNVEIAPSSRTSEKEIRPSEQVSYRNAP